MASAERNIFPKTDLNLPDFGLFAEAERELSAFMKAVSETHGPHALDIAFEHWIAALDGRCLPKRSSQECFRKVTVAAVASMSLAFPGGYKNPLPGAFREANPLEASAPADLPTDCWENFWIPSLEYSYPLS